MMEEAIRKRAISHRKELSRRPCIMRKTQAARARAVDLGKESSHCEWTASTWTFAKDYLPVQFEPTHSTVQRVLLTSPVVLLSPVLPLFSSYSLPTGSTPGETQLTESSVRSLSRS